jgi:hypothetical protein
MSVEGWLPGLFWTNVAVLCMLVAVLIIHTFRLYGLWRVRTFATMLSPDKRTLKTLVLDPSEETFKWKNGRYYITPAWVTHHNHRYLFYVKNNPNPVDLTDTRAVVPADVVEAVHENRALISMNKPKSLFSNLNWKVVAIGAAVLLGALYLLQKGGLS